MKDNNEQQILKYPYLTFSESVQVKPVFENLAGDPFVVDLSVMSPVYDAVNVLDQHAFQAYLDDEMKGRYSWGMASYLENRKRVLAEYPQMMEEKRFFHLGLDIIVPLATDLHAPLDAVVEASGYESGNGNYGAHILLRHDSPCFETFYSMYGHLNRDRLPRIGESFAAGDTFAYIGDFHENGNWFYHTHLQVITQKGLENGYLSKGYCSLKDLEIIDTFCPSPLPLFRI